MKLLAITLFRYGNVKFNGHLTEAVLLRRVFGFLSEIVLPNKQKMMIRCPNLGSIEGCDILGTKIWYSNAIGYHSLPTWELVEVDGGYLVSVNPELMKPLFIEAVKFNILEELMGYTIVHTSGFYEHNQSQFLVLENQDAQQCYVGMEHVILSTEQNEGLFPTQLGEGQDTLQALIQAKEDGHRAILFYCVTHTGIDSINPAHHIDAEYHRNLCIAVAEGVEVIAYKTAISLQGIELSKSIPIVFSEDAISPGSS